MKKILSIVLLLTLLCGMAVPSLADDAVTVVPAVADAFATSAGQEISLTLTLPVPVSGIGAGKMDITVDDGLEYVKGKWKISPQLKSEIDAKRQYTFAYSKGTTLSGDIFTATVKVPENATASSVYHITFQLGLTDENTLQSLDVQAVTATVRFSCSHPSYETKWTSDASYHWHACTSCGTPQQQIAHVYDNACDTNCNVCGYVRQTSHQFSKDWKSDASGHWHTCTVCGAKSDSASHTPGAAATENSAQTCTVCGFVIKPALGHTHVYSTNWSSNGTYHWHACTSCDETKDKAKHIYDSSCDTTCNVCGAVRKITHTYTTWTRDDGSHWHVCSVCGNIADKTAHVYDNSCDAICDICGYVRDVKHSFGQTYHSDAEGHWTVCTVCGIPSVKSAHTPAAAASETDPSICSVCLYEIAAAAGHTFSDWALTKLPTLTEEGQMTRVCACGETETIPFPKLTEENAFLGDKLSTIFTPEELLAIANGASYGVYLATEPTEIPTLDVQGTVVGCYNFLFYKQVGEGEPIALSGFTTPTTVVLTVPEASRNSDPNVTRTYRAAVVSNGELTSMIDGTYDEEKGTFTFVTNGNLSGALLYTDEVHQSQRVDSSDWILYAVVGTAAAAGIATAIILFIKKKKEE